MPGLTPPSQQDTAHLGDNEMPTGLAEADRVCLQISTSKRYRLLACHALGVTEFRCLDCDSKHRVRQLFLHACSKQLRAKGCNG